MDSEKIWIGRLEKRLVPLSYSDDPITATSEWFFTGEVLENSVFRCELCMRPELRFNYEIQNLKTGKTMMVGSVCILTFPDIAIYETDNVLAEGLDDRKRVLKQALKKAEINLMLNPLRELYAANESIQDQVHGCVNIYLEKGTFFENLKIWKGMKLFVLELLDRHSHCER